MTSPPTITAHALIRYAKRILGLDVGPARKKAKGKCESIVLAHLTRQYKLDVADLRQRILATDERMRQAIEQLGTGTFTLPTHRIRLRNRHVITVLPLEWD